MVSFVVAVVDIDIVVVVDRALHKMAPMLHDLAVLQKIVALV